MEKWGSFSKASGAPLESVLKCATWWLFRGVPTLSGLASRRGLHAEQHTCLPSVFVHSYLSNWTLLAVFPCALKSQDKLSQSRGATWLLETTGPVPRNLLQPSCKSVHWTVLTRIPSTEAICPCVRLMMLGHDTWIFNLHRSFGFSFPQKISLLYIWLTKFAHQETNPHETPRLIHWETKSPWNTWTYSFTSFSCGDSATPKCEDHGIVEVTHECMKTAYKNKKRWWSGKENELGSMGLGHWTENNIL